MGLLPLPDLTAVFGATASAAGAALGLDPPCALLLGGRRGEPETVAGTPLPAGLAGALADRGLALGALARGAEGPFLLRAAALPVEADGLAAALRAHEMEGLAVLPLRGLIEAVACLVVPIRQGRRWTRGGAGGELLSTVPAALQVAAGSRILERILQPSEDPSAGPAEGAVVLDPGGRVVLADGWARLHPAWGRADPFGRPFAELPRPSAGPGEGDGGALESAGGVLLLSGRPPAAGPDPVLPWPVSLASRVHAAAAEVAASMGPALGGDPQHGSPLRSLVEEAGRARSLARRVVGALGAIGEPVEVVDLAQVAAAVLEDHQEALGRRKVRVFSFIAPAACPHPADLLAARDVIHALVARARASLAPGGGTLTLRTWTEDGWACAAVSDDGGGARAAAVEPADAVLDGSSRRDEERLDDLARVVESLGGRFSVERRPGVWNRCTVMLPASAGAVALRSGAATTVRRAPDGGLRVLVVDDNAALRSVLRRYLERRGHTVTEAADGDDAVRAVARGENFDRLVVDMHMPGRSGPEFYGALGSVAPDLRERTLFMTGDLSDPATERFLSSAGRPAIAKPFDLADLARRLEGAA